MYLKSTRENIQEATKKVRNKKKLSFGAKMIEKFLKPEFHKNMKIWPREIKISKKLLEIEPSESFWLNITLNFRLNSLAFFLSEEGKSMIEERKKMSTLDLTPKNTIIEFGKEKIGEDFLFTKEKKLKELLK